MRLVQGASYIYRYILAPCTNFYLVLENFNTYFSVYSPLSFQNFLVPIVSTALNEGLTFLQILIHNIPLWVEPMDIFFYLPIRPLPMTAKQKIAPFPI